MHNELVYFIMLLTSVINISVHIIRTALSAADVYRSFCTADRSAMRLQADLDITLQTKQPQCGFPRQLSGTPPPPTHTPPPALCTGNFPHLSAQAYQPGSLPVLQRSPHRCALPAGPVHSQLAYHYHKNGTHRRCVARSLDVNAAKPE